MAWRGQVTHVLSGETRYFREWSRLLEVLSSATILYLDWLDAQGNPHREDLSSKYAGYKKLGVDGWKLVQMIERAAFDGMDGPIPPTTHQYFTRPARSKG